MMLDLGDPPQVPAELLAAILADPTLSGWQDETGQAGVYLTRLARTLGIRVRRGRSIELTDLAPEDRAALGRVLAAGLRKTAAARAFGALGGLH